jgi:predicted nucleotidyltransferase
MNELEIETMEEKIKRALAHIEEQENIQILYATESGSRAWGFESPDSDYDVRYIYVRPLSWYLTIDPGRDVIDHYHKQPYIAGTEFDDPLLDITGWDLKKAMYQMRKSNPQISEWLRSSIVYRTGIRRELLRLNVDTMRLHPALAHYRSMANTNFREFLQGENVRFKKYLYVLRPLFAAQWIMHRKSFPPMEFESLIDSMVNTFENATELKASLYRLLALKRQASEVQDGPRDPVLHEFIERELKRTDSLPDNLPDQTETLNQFFRAQLPRWDCA